MKFLSFIIAGAGHQRSRSATLVASLFAPFQATVRSSRRALFGKLTSQLGSALSLSLVLALAAAGLGGCATAPPDTPAVPSWVRQSARATENGSLVFVESEDDVDPALARAKAEGLALADVANECSLVPRGARFEAQYLAKTSHLAQAHVKLRVPATACEAAKRANTSASVRGLGDAEAAARVRLFQERNGEPRLEDARAGDEALAYMIARQRLALLKQQVLLVPAGAGEEASFAEKVVALARDVERLEGSREQLKQSAQPWSHYRHELMRPKFGPDGAPLAAPGPQQSRRAPGQSTGIQ